VTTNFFETICDHNEKSHYKELSKLLLGKDLKEVMRQLILFAMMVFNHSRSESSKKRFIQMLPPVSDLVEVIREAKKLK
jgi:hypothetical protein